MTRRSGRVGLGALGAAISLLLGPAAAAAADRFVDAETGSNAGTDCTQVTPCLTLGHAITNSANGDTIKVDNGTYAEAISLHNGRSLAYADFVTGDGTARPLIDGGATEAITVGGTGGGTISGVRVHSATTGVFLEAPTIVDNVVFDEPDSSNAIGVQVANTGSGSEIRNSAFSDPNTDPTRLRSGIYALGRVWIHDNDFDGFMVAINVSDPASGETLVEGNDIIGTHNLPNQGRSILAQGSDLSAGELVIRENRLSAADGSGVMGINPSGPVRLVRNEITGHDTGVFIGIDSTGTTIVGDRYWGNSLEGLRVLDTGPAPPQASVTATNVTSVGNGVDVWVENAQLTLNSSIVGVMVPLFGPSCTVDFSIGPPNPGSDTTGCFDFDSNADPQLADPATGDLHLTAGSPAIDTGDPADPGVGAVDFDGDPRAVDGADGCPPEARRDIGADEFVPAGPIDCTPPETTITSGLADGSLTNDPTQQFGFGSSEPGSTFQCAVDGAAFSACTGAAQHVVDLSGAADGAHTFSVRATDPSGNLDPTPGSRSFRLDRSPPETTLTKKPPKRLKKKRAVFAFTSDEESTYTCRLDSKPEFSCAGTARLKVKRGKHIFRVFATDAAGNDDASPAKHRFKRVKKKRRGR